MEPKTDAEMTAILRARKVARRKKLRRRAAGLGPWAGAAVMSRDIDDHLDRLRSIGVDARQVDADEAGNGTPE